MCSYIYFHSSDDDLIDSVLAANNVRQPPAHSHHHQYLQAERPVISRRNSTASTGSESDTYGVSGRPHMPPIEIPYDLSHFSIALSRDTDAYSIGAGISDGNRNISSGGSTNSERRYRQRLTEGAGNSDALSVQSSGDQSRNFGSTRRRHSGSAVVVEVTPVNPSIPQPRSGADLHLDSRPPAQPTINIEAAPPIGATRKPPTGNVSGIHIQYLLLSNKHTL